MIAIPRVGRVGASQDAGFPVVATLFTPKAGEGRVGLNTDGRQSRSAMPDCRPGCSDRLQEEKRRERRRRGGGREGKGVE